MVDKVNRWFLWNTHCEKVFSTRLCRELLLLLLSSSNINKAALTSPFRHTWVSKVSRTYLGLSQTWGFVSRLWSLKNAENDIPRDGTEVSPRSEHEKMQNQWHDGTYPLFVWEEHPALQQQPWDIGAIGEINFDARHLEKCLQGLRSRKKRGRVEGSPPQVRTAPAMVQFCVVKFPTFVLFKSIETSNLGWLKNCLRMTCWHESPSPSHFGPARFTRAVE